MLEVTPGLAGVDDDTGQGRAAAAGEQDRVLAQPVARPVVLVEDDRVRLVDGQRTVRAVESCVERLGAGGEAATPRLRRRKVPRGQGDECVARSASPVTPRRGPARATEAGARCAGSVWRMPPARGAPRRRGRPRRAIAPATLHALPPDVRSGTCERAPRRARARRGSPGWHSRIEHVAGDRAPPRRTPGERAADGDAGASGAKPAAAPGPSLRPEARAPSDDRGRSGSRASERSGGARARSRAPGVDVERCGRTRRGEQQERGDGEGESPPTPRGRRFRDREASG